MLYFKKSYLKECEVMESYTMREPIMLDDGNFMVVVKCIDGYCNRFEITIYMGSKLFGILPYTIYDDTIEGLNKQIKDYMRSME